MCISVRIPDEGGRNEGVFWHMCVSNGGGSKNVVLARETAYICSV